MANKSRSRKKASPKRKPSRKKPVKKSSRKKASPKRKPSRKASRKRPSRKSKKKPTAKRKSRKPAKKSSRKSRKPAKKSSRNSRKPAKKKAKPKRKPSRKSTRRKATPKRKSPPAKKSKSRRYASSRKPRSNKNVLTIGQSKIESISGPVSFNLLKPKMDYFKDLYKSTKTYAPVFMLFGDVHRSDKRMCKPCACGMSSCCYPIYSKDFLHTIDSIYEPKFPIDFGIEGGIISNDQMTNKSGGHKADYPMAKLRDQLLVCYNRELRGKKIYKQKCPTENIRWQLMDARRRNFSQYNFEYFLYSISTFFKDHVDDVIKNFDRLKKDIGLDYVFIYIDHLKKFIRQQNFDDMYDQKLQKHSVIFKQIKKMSKEQQKQWEKYVKEYYHMVLYNPELKGGKLTKNDFKELYLYLDLLTVYFDNFSHASTKERRRYLKDMEREIDIDSKDTILYRLSVASLDLYYLTREFKKPKNDMNPLLSISFFGARHTRNIVYFLTNIMRTYDTVYKTGRVSLKDRKGETSRCLKMEKDINLNDILDEYKKIV